MEITLSGCEVQSCLGFFFGWVDLVCGFLVGGWVLFGFFCLFVVLNRYADWDLNGKNFMQSWAFLWLWASHPPAKTQEQKMLS